MRPTASSSLYHRQVERYPLLSAAEEQALARELTESGAPELAQRLARANLRLVLKIAAEYGWTRHEFADLVQAGNVGLVLAVERFDPARNVRFATYASWWIRAYVLRWVVDNWRIVRIGKTAGQRRALYHLRRAKALLEAQGTPIDYQRLAAKLGVREDLELLDEHVSAAEASLDVAAPDGTPAVERLASADRPDLDLEEREHRAAVMAAVSEFAARLAGRDASLFRRRWLDEEPATLQEIGDGFGISRERTRQLEARLLARLRTHVNARLRPRVLCA